MTDTCRTRARLLAYYLPQYYPIPENDCWWGPGFTEWTNVAKARPLYPGHYQPHIPADLGFYDLRVPETRLAQAEMARSHGIQGFAYWHYWFGNGRRLLERPFGEVLTSGQPDFPFCLGWANASWTGVWYGAEDRVLIEQTYPGIADDCAHFEAILPALSDPRYVLIDGRPAFFIFRPLEIPEPLRFTDTWRELALKAGLKGMYFLGILSGGWETWDPTVSGFDAAVVNNLQPAFALFDKPSNWYIDRLSLAAARRPAARLLRDVLRRPRVVTYRKAISVAIPRLSERVVQYPTVMPNWDNTPRSGLNGIVFHDSNPDLFRLHLKSALAQVASRPADQRVVVVKSWNEWAEGNHLEPDQRFGLQYLEVIREELRFAESPKPAESNV